MRTQQLIQAMTKTVLILTLFFVIRQTVNAQNFVKSYDFPPTTTRTEIGRSIENDITGGWSIAGYSNSTPNAGGNDWMFLRLDNSGFVKCAALLGFSNNDTCYSHIQLGSTINDYVLTGSYYDVNAGKNKASFSILDTNCSHVVSKQIFDTLEHTYRQVVKDPANNFTLVGYSEGVMYPWVNKVLAAQYSPTVNLAWAFHYITGVPSTEEAYSVCFQPTDGSYAMTGRTNYIAGPGQLFDVFVTKLTPTGLPIWTKVYSFQAPGVTSNSRRIIPMADGGFVIIGWTNAFDPTARDVWVFRIDPFGFPMWSAIYGVPSIIEEGHSIILSSDGTLVFTGYTNTLGTNDVLNVKIPAIPPLAPIWARVFDKTTPSDRGYDLKEAYGPAGYAFTGQTMPPVSSSLDPFLMRTDNIGNVTSGCVDSITLPHLMSPLHIDSMVLYPEGVADRVINPSKVNPNPAIRNLCVVTTNTKGYHGVLPNEYKLKQNYPNPFNPTTNIEFLIPVDEFVSLKIYDVSGREVANLISEFKNKGVYIMSFNASNLPSGTYFYKLTSGEFNDVKKMILLK